MDEEQRTILSEQLASLAQSNHDHDMLHMQEDILQHFTDETEQFISAFENLEHSDSEDNSEFYDRIHECREQYFRDLTHPTDDQSSTISADDDLLENTDTEDGAEEVIDLLTSNRNLTGLLSEHTKHIILGAYTAQEVARIRDLDVIALLDSNTQLVSLLSKQRQIIARLRARIIRLGDLLTLMKPLNQVHNGAPEIDTRVHNIEESNQVNARLTADATTDLIFMATELPPSSSIDTRSSIHPGSRSHHGTTPSPTAFVLMDSTAFNPDMTLSAIGPQFDPKIHLRFLTDEKIQRELLRKQEFLKSQSGAHGRDDHSPQLWMFFDSGASRSVISPTSPIRRHLTQSRPVIGSCSIGDGTPLEYIEKGMFNNTIDTTVVRNLKYDLFSSVSAAKLGLTSR
jgi:hypothetical protein